MVLSYSRMRYVEFSTSMRQEVLMGCHQRAFEYFGGVPETILYDNMKQIRIGPGRLHPLFVDFASHRPWYPRTKGKVERSVGYVKDNFLRGVSSKGSKILTLSVGLGYKQPTPKCTPLPDASPAICCSKKGFNRWPAYAPGPLLNAVLDGSMPKHWSSCRAPNTRFLRVIAGTGSKWRLGPEPSRSVREI
jgi:hypothetical protein